MSSEQIHEIQMKAIENWRPAREMWMLRYGAVVLGAISGLSGFIFVNHFRQRMMLRSVARLATHIPSIVLPSIATTAAQYSLVTYPLIVGEMECPVCSVTRCISIQLAIGFLQPLVLAVAATSGIAKTTRSYPLPPFSEPGALLRVYVKLLRPLKLTMAAMVFLSSVNAVVVVYRQMEAANKLHTKVADSSVFISQT